MKIPSKFQILFVSLVLIGLGVQAILNGVIPAYKGKATGPALAFPISEPYVPYVGAILVAGGLYLFLKCFRTGERK